MAQTKPKAGQFYGVSGNGTDGQFLQTDGAGGMDWADTTVAPTLTSIDYPGTATAADPAGGESIIINGTGFQTGITCTVGGTSATTAFNSATQITITSPAKAAGQYTVAVTNTDGGNGSAANFIQYSGVPVWSTNSGSLGSVQEGASASFQVTATEGSDTIEYAVTSGSLPSGYSLATATGAITGTAGAVSADTTSTFSITATDDENQTSSARSFSITVTAILPSQHFNTTLYTGTGATLAITGVAFQPDMVWVKNYGTSGYNHCLQDSVRGPSSNLNILYPDGTFAQSTNTGSNYFNSLNSDGFTVASSAYFGASSNSYVAWSWKAGGAPTATNAAAAGSVPTLGSVMVDGTASTSALAGTLAVMKISANTTLGLSIIQYNGGTGTLPHELGVTPRLIIQKNQDATNPWYTYIPPGVIDANYNYLELNTTATLGQTSSTAPTSTTFNPVSTDTGPFIAYAFADKAGFCKIDKYTGNGSENGPIIQTGFQPAFILIKNTSAAENWEMFDDKRSVTNPRDDVIFANLNYAEYTNQSQKKINFLEDGFQIAGTDGSVNGNGNILLYIAFAADPSTTTPSLADSFSAVLNTSPTTNQAIAAGFTPDIAWIKGATTSPTSWGQYDTIRGDGEVLQSDNDQAEYDYSGHPSGDLGMKFTSTGYTTPPVTNDNINNSSGDFINYFWKAGGGLGSINTDGTISSIVSANQAAGISIVKFSSSSSNSTTVGHGLGAIPQLVIAKRLDSTGNWAVMAPVLGNGYTLLNTDGSYQGADASIWNNTAPTSSVFTTAGGSGTFFNAGNFIAYLFTSITGFSKIGSYVGNNPTAVSVNVGFNPDFLIFKNTTNGTDWLVYDKQRSPTGNYDEYIYLNLTDAQGTTGGNWVTPTATGFTTNSSGGSLVNESGSTYLYVAFKQN
jgi:hypothetical protein